MSAQPTLSTSPVTASPARPVRLILHRATSCGELERRMVAAAERVQSIHAGCLEVVDRRARSSATAPCLSVVHRARTVARFLAAPDGPEEQPFLRLLATLCAASRPPAARTAPRLPAGRLSVFVAADCPRCPVAVGSALELAAEHPHTTVDVIDAKRFPALAARIPVRSVPTLVADTGLTVVGLVSPDQLIARLVDSSGARREAVVLESLLAAGRFAEAGRRLAAGNGTTAFAELWLSSSLESRIGLLLAAEEALARNPSCLDPVAAGLEAALGRESAALRGDTADLLRRLALPASRAALVQRARDPDPDVVEAVAEALAAIDARRKAP